jgi:hypothetical protein
MPAKNYFSSTRTAIDPTSRHPPRICPWLMANVWPLDLNVEFHETIKQGAFRYRRGSTNSVADLGLVRVEPPAVDPKRVQAILDADKPK